MKKLIEKNNKIEITDEQVKKYFADNATLFTGKKLEKNVYQRHSGYPGGLKTSPLAKIFKEEPARLFTKMVYNMLPKNKLRKEMIKRLKVN